VVRANRWIKPSTLHETSLSYGKGSRILGFVCAHDFGFRAYLSELVVDPDSLHRGIGTRLLQAVEESLRQKGQQVLIADVWRDAELFYRSLGWESPDVVLLRQHLEKKS
jgi:GNAT superfamily N-acetyltransferase